MKLPPTFSPEEQGEDQHWHSAEPPVPVFGERGQPLSLPKVKLILSPGQESSREGGSQLLSELTKPWRWHCWPPSPSSEVPREDGAPLCVCPWPERGARKAYPFRHPDISPPGSGGAGLLPQPVLTRPEEAPAA